MLKLYFYDKMANHVVSAKAGGSGSVNQVLPQERTCWILTHPAPQEVWVGAVWAGFGTELWVQLTVAGQPLSLVSAELSLTLSPELAGWPPLLHVKVPPAPGVWLHNAWEQPFLLAKPWAPCRPPKESCGKARPWLGCFPVKAVRLVPQMCNINYFILQGKT